MYDLTPYGLTEIPLLGYYRFRQAQQALRPHSHDAFEILYQLEGQQQYLLADREYVLSTGDMFITYPGELHDTGMHPQHRASLYWLHIHPPPPGQGALGLSSAETSMLLQQLRTLERRQFPGSLTIKDIFTRLWQLKDSLTTPGQLLRMRVETVCLLLEMLQCQARVALAQYSPPIQRVTAWIADHLTDELPVPQLVQLAAMSPSWFKERFCREVGVPPAEYVLQRKIDAACTLLQHGEHTITGVAMQMGFSSSQYFATTFRRYMGQSPSAWRRQRRV
jgi:AraC-like DNA-binding protein